MRTLQQAAPTVSDDRLAALTQHCKSSQDELVAMLQCWTQAIVTMVANVKSDLATLAQHRIALQQVVPYKQGADRDVVVKLVAGIDSYTKAVNERLAKFDKSLPDWAQVLATWRATEKQAWQTSDEALKNDVREFYFKSSTDIVVPLLRTAVALRDNTLQAAQGATKAMSAAMAGEAKALQQWSKTIDSWDKSLESKGFFEQIQEGITAALSGSVVTLFKVGLLILAGAAILSYGRRAVIDLWQRGARPSRSEGSSSGSKGTKRKRRRRRRRLAAAAA